jgi:hypothetical protein
MDACVLADRPACGGQSGHGVVRLHPGGRHQAGFNLVFAFVANPRNVGAMAGLGVAVTVDAGVAATVAEALGPGVGSVVEAPKAAEVSPAVNTRLNRTDAPERFTRDDFILLLVLSEYLSALRGAAVRTPNQLDGPGKPQYRHPPTYSP